MTMRENGIEKTISFVVQYMAIPAIIPNPLQYCQICSEVHVDGNRIILDKYTFCCLSLNIYIQNA